MTRMILAAALACSATAGMALEVSECDWKARADSIAEPWEAYTRTFANGDVRLALLDTVEPAAAAFHILIISPPYDELGTRQCRTLGMASGGGFSGVTFDALDATYDPSVGLIFNLPVATYDGSNGEFIEGELLFTLNQATGDIDAWLD
ncbi:MAG: hypothetical protein ACU0A2_07430 [Cognatishimia sp.]|uniref:hypothetical protein n=1 Tax=Cognatishimia sp. TaxID=2211648 RepID=UPI004059F64C